MNREIKFRAWNKERQVMSDVAAINFDEFIIDDRGLKVPFHKIELLQYTGLKDCNGTEIYEGDILGYKGNYKPYRSVIEYVTEDIGSCGCCYPAFDGAAFVGRILTFDSPDYAKSFYRQEVIGNIYENPELLDNQ